jgi:hypothetical protein
MNLISLTTKWPETTKSLETLEDNDFNNLIDLLNYMEDI